MELNGHCLAVRKKQKQRLSEKVKVGLNSSRLSTALNILIKIFIQNPFDWS